MLLCSYREPSGALYPPDLFQRNPSILSGLEQDDVEDWLHAFEGVSRHNRWDHETRLKNVVFSLRGVARTCFIKHEDDLQSWTAFFARFTDLF